MKKIWTATLSAVLVLALVGCGKAQLPAETTATTVETTTAEITTAETSAPIETAEPQITAAPSALQEIEALPTDPASALLTASPVGGNPTFYIFEEGLTYYVQVLGDPQTREVLSVSECVLSLPEGYADGRIVAASGGAGSGEILLTVLAKQDGETVCLVYLLYSDAVAVPQQIWVKREPVHVLADNGTVTL